MTSRADDAVEGLAAACLAAVERRVELALVVEPARRHQRIGRGRPPARRSPGRGLPRSGTGAQRAETIAAIIIDIRWWSRPSSRGQSTRFPAATSIQTRSRSCTACTNTNSTRIWSAAVCATCCSAAGRRISTSARPPIPTRSRSSSATAGSSAAASGWPTSSTGPKTIEVATFRRQVDPSELPADAPQIDEELEAAPEPPLDRRRVDRGADPVGRHAPGARARARSADPSRQHVRHARRGRLPPRLHHQRALLRHRHVSRSSTTSAGSKISRTG